MASVDAKRQPLLGSDNGGAAQEKKRDCIGDGTYTMGWPLV